MIENEQMELNPLTLRFCGRHAELEEGFQDYYFRLSLPVFRWGFALGILLYACFGILDAVSMPQIKEQLWRIRFLFVIPILLAGVAFSFHPSFKRYWQAAIFIMIATASAGIFWMIAIGIPPESYHYYTGIMLVVFFCFTFLRARFVWAAALSIFLVVMFEVTSLVLTDPPAAVLMNTNFFFNAAMVIGMVACYSLEFFARKNYYLMILLDREKKKLSRLNADLKKRVQELKEAHKEIKILSGLIPICSHCKKIRDDKGYWNQIESYISEHSDAVFSHALCPECLEELYGHEEWFHIVRNESSG